MSDISDARNGPNISRLSLRSAMHVIDNVHVKRGARANCERRERDSGPARARVGRWRATRERGAARRAPAFFHVEIPPHAISANKTTLTPRVWCARCELPKLIILSVAFRRARSQNRQLSGRAEPISHPSNGPSLRNIEFAVYQSSGGGRAARALRILIFIYCLLLTCLGARKPCQSSIVDITRGRGRGSFIRLYTDAQHPRRESQVE